jgi:hypothetical protein
MVLKISMSSIMIAAAREVPRWILLVTFMIVLLVYPAICGTFLSGPGGEAENPEQVVNRKGKRDANQKDAHRLALLENTAMVYRREKPEGRDGEKGMIPECRWDISGEKTDPGAGRAAQGTGNFQKSIDGTSADRQERRRRQYNCVKTDQGRDFNFFHRKSKEKA